MAKQANKANKAAPPQKVQAKKNITGRAPPSDRNYSGLYILLLIVIPGLCYFSSLSNGFTNWDDNGYILNNPLVWSINLRAIFSTFVMGNYHPITVLFQAIEYQVFQTSASGYHIVSLMIHIVNSLLLFFILKKIIPNPLISFLGALIFAVHPMHVESVAWVSAQKDLFYTCFYLAAILFYLKYDKAEGSTRKNYLLVFVFFILSLLSKGQAVTLPVILLLIDWFNGKIKNPKKWIEKIPLFALSIVFGIVAIIAQKQSQSIQDIHSYTPTLRILFASYAFCNYLLRFIVPYNLSAYYPYPEPVNGTYPAIIFLAPLLLLGVLAISFFLFRKKQIFWLFGILFFGINIFLVLQLLPVGGAITADRYSYLSFVGFILVVCFLLQYIQKNFPLSKSVSLVICCAWIFFLSIEAHGRSLVWKSSETLWKDVLSKNKRVPIACNNLGSFYKDNNQIDSAKKYLDAAIRLQPEFQTALGNLCDVYARLNMLDSALIAGNHAMRLKPDDTYARMNRGIAFGMAGKYDSAMMDFRMVEKAEPGNPRVHNNIGNLFIIGKQPDSAIDEYFKAIALDPDFTEAIGNRGIAYVQTKQFEKGISDLNNAIIKNSGNAQLFYYRMQANIALGNLKAAGADAQQAEQLGMQIPNDVLEQLK